MKTINHWADKPLPFKATLRGERFKDTKKVEFAILEKDAEIARVEGKLDAKTGVVTASWDKPKAPDAPAYFRHLEYRLDVDGKPLQKMPDDIKLWARDLKVVTQDKDGKGYAGAICVLKWQKPDADGQPSGAEKQKVLKTDKTGTIPFRLQDPAEVTVELQKPYFLLDKWDKEKGTAWEAKVQKIVPVKIVSPAVKKDAVHKQLVNLDADPKKPEQGPTLKVKIGPGSLGKLDKGAKAFLKAEFGAANSARTPMTGGKAKGETLELNKEVDDKGEATFDVPVGYAGGDKITVNVGSTDACSDAKIEVVTWRRLEYELMAPNAMKPRMQSAKIAGKNGLDFPKKTQKWFSERLAEVFVELVPRASHMFDNAKASKFLVDGAFLGKGGSEAKQQFYLLGVPYGMDSANDPESFGTVDNRTLFIRLCDLSTYTLTDPPQAEPAFEVTSVTEEAVTTEILPVDPGTGNAMITKVEWEAVTTDAAHPGFGKKGVLPITAVTPTVLGRCKIDLSSSAEAKKLVGAATAKKCPIAVIITHVQIMWINGAAVNGRQIINLNRPLAAAACTICHELGHNMGLGVMATGTFKVEPPEGLATPDPIPAGNYYDGKGHVGAHCATGLTVDQKNEPAFNVPGAPSGTCIMYGSGADEETPTRDKYCPVCQNILRARNLTDIKSRFSGRANTGDYDVHA